MKRQKKLTKKERKALEPGRRSGLQGQAQHIHCIACGRHIEPGEFSSTPASAVYVTCDHGSRFASCISCAIQAESLVAEHDRSGQPVKTAAAWH
jgi:ribosomal protein S26